MGWMTGFELHQTHRYINKIKDFARQITAKPGKKFANLQPVATRNRTLKTRLHPRGMSHEHSSRPSRKSLESISFSVMTTVSTVLRPRVGRCEATVTVDVLPHLPSIILLSR